MGLLRYIFAFLIIIISAWANNTCPAAPFYDINFTQINGTWYAIQGIEHGELRGHRRQNSSYMCPVVNLTITTNPILIKFVFDRKNENKPNTYNLMVNDTKTSSVWSLVPVKRFCSLRSNYILKSEIEDAVTLKTAKTFYCDLKRTPFDLIQVTSLTNNAILLTMCSDKRKGSVVLSRNNIFDLKIAKKANVTLTERHMVNKGVFNRCVRPED